MSQSARFPGGLFSDAIEGKRAGATLSLSSDGVGAETSDGQRFHLPFARCTLEQGGASGRMIFCHAPDRSLTLYSEDRAFLAALAAAGGSAVAGQVEALRGAARKRRSRSWQFGLAGVAVLALAGFGAYHGVQAAAAASVDALPIAVDDKIGALALQSMPLQGERVTDPVLVGAVEEMVARLAPHAAAPGSPAANMDFEVTVVRAPVLNAFCLPGGKIVVYTGLLAAAGSPEQIAGVLAHEMAHATKRHGLQRIASSVGIVVGVNLLLGDVSGLVAVAVELAQHGLLTSHGREQETEADREAVRMMSAAGLSPDALAALFSILAEKEGDIPGALAWLSSHPQLAERQRSIRAQAAEQDQGPAQPFALDWAAVKARAGADAGTAPDNRRDGDAPGADDDEGVAL